MVWNGPVGVFEFDAFGHGTEALARAIAEQRRILALDASQRDHVLDMLNALMLRPEETIKNIPHYLGLTTIRSRLRLSHIEDELRDTADYMWQVALGIEDGNLSAAERRLRQAQEALRNALQKGATPEEIAKLSEELRKAMQDFLREFAQRQQQNPNASRLPPNPNARVLSQKDLQRLMDQIEELAKQGARDQAEQLLSQLQSLLNNLQMAQPNGQGQGQGQSQSRQMQNQMNRLGDLMRRQQQNMNDTFALDKKLQDQYGMGEDFFGSQDGEQENGNIPSDMAETMLLGRHGQRLGGHQANDQPANQAGACGCGNAVHIIEREICLFQRAPDQTIQCLDMGAGGNFWYNAAIGFMLGNLAQNHI